MIVRWVPTSIEVVAVINARHHDEMAVFGSSTEVDVRIYTEWGFRGADAPVYRTIMTGVRRTDSEHWEYALAVVVSEND